MFNAIINRSVELSDEQIKAQAPSVFAAAPQAGVSVRYTFLPTAQIVSRMRQEGWAPVEVQQQAVRVEGRMGFQKHVIRFQRKDQIAKPGEYAAELALVNSHDRSSAYQIHTALYRFVCANGLMVSDSAFEPVSIRHSGRETEEVISASFGMLAQVPRLGQRTRLETRRAHHAPHPRSVSACPLAHHQGQRPAPRLEHATHAPGRAHRLLPLADQTERHHAQSRQRA
jgi:hypothetical protein